MQWKMAQSSPSPVFSNSQLPSIAIVAFVECLHISLIARDNN